MDANLKIERLKTRAQFLAAARAPACARGAVLIQRLARPEHLAAPSLAAGFTATKKIGNAVVRNRCKRRLREAARQLLPLHGEAGHDYVFIARAGLPDRPWDRLLDDVTSALVSLAAGRADPARPPRLNSKKRRSVGPAQQPTPGKTPPDE